MTDPVGEPATWECRLSDAWGEAWALQGLAGAAIKDRALQDAVGLLLESLASARRAQSRPAVASVLQLLATVGFVAGRRELAAELLGGARLVSTERRPLWSVELDGLRAVRADALSAALGQERLEEHWARGRAQTTDEIVAIAARELATPSP